MAKKGMARPERTHVKPKNEQKPVPEIQNKADQDREKPTPNISASDKTGCSSCN